MISLFSALIQFKGWILVSHQQGRVGAHPQPPTHDPYDVVEERLWVLAGKQNGEAGHNHGEEYRKH
jgi:hypothetical protein